MTDGITTETKKDHATKPIGISPFPYRVDIIVPFHGQYDKVTKLVESIFRCTMSNVYKVILVDDCSPNKSYAESLSKVPGLITVRTKDQLGFGGALRVGFEKSQELDRALRDNNRPQHPFVVFMQSDCVVEDVDWLRAMGSTLLGLKDQGVKMVAPRTNNPMGGDPRQGGEKGNIGETIILEDTSLSLYCAMCHRELFQHIGGFIKEYPLGWYEDEELAYRMRKYGYKQAIAGRSWVRHVGQATIREVWREQPNSRRIMMEDNRKKCIQDIRALTTR